MSTTSSCTCTSSASSSSASSSPSPTSSEPSWTTCRATRYVTTPTDTQTGRETDGLVFTLSLLVSVCFVFTLVGNTFSWQTSSTNSPSVWRNGSPGILEHLVPDLRWVHLLRVCWSLNYMVFNCPDFFSWCESRNPHKCNFVTRAVGLTGWTFWFLSVKINSRDLK